MFNGIRVMANPRVKYSHAVEHLIQYVENYSHFDNCYVDQSTFPDHIQQL